MKNNLLSEHLVYNGESETPTHFHLCTYDAKSFEETSADDFASIEQKLLPGRIHWLQIHGLRNTETVRRVCAHFQISFLTMQDILNVGDEVDVKLLEIDPKTGKMRLSRKALLDKPEGYVEPERRPRPSSDRGPRRNGNGNDRRNGERPSGNGKGPRGPRRENRGPKAEHDNSRTDNGSNGYDGGNYNDPEMF